MVCLNDDCEMYNYVFQLHLLQASPQIYISYGPFFYYSRDIESIYQNLLHKCDHKLTQYTDAVCQNYYLHQIFLYIDAVLVADDVVLIVVDVLHYNPHLPLVLLQVVFVAVAADKFENIPQCMWLYDNRKPTIHLKERIVRKL